MPNVKPPREGSEMSKNRYRSNGIPIWSKRAIDGPGIWVSCVKGKEKPTVGELYDLFESLASELWPETPATEADDDDGHDDSGVEDLEKQIAKELASIKAPRKGQRFANCQTNTPCVLFISCKAPVDPVRLVLKHIENVENTGVTHTRYAHRLTPVTNTCVANAPEIKSLAQRVLKLFLMEDPQEDCCRYKIELKVRNHNTLSRQTLIDTVVSCVPSRWTVDLEHAQVFVLVEVFKSVCGIGIVKDYYAHRRFNVMEIANTRNSEAGLGDGRLTVPKGASDGRREN
ncbi:hypothetical protein F5148DRAFT_454674 [Russula earlei]|uniref:Uncharacterized protein n=1 Tax=Russula earlei TaxID=71964 RepID=A0ACC0UID9_9AGAM|nr:hypothetical protein F5148DRAFT_454674 [Russula earlei]